MGKAGRIFDMFRYAMTSEKSAFYVGWLGAANLGDEILVDAIRDLVAPITLATMQDHQARFLENVLSWKRHSVTILGGGTQIGHPSPIDRFRLGLARSRIGVVLGAGVSSVESDRNPEWLDIWGDTLRGLPYVGVRGTESVATLARVGVAAEALGDPVCHFSQPTNYWSPASGVFGINVGHSFGHMHGNEQEIQRTTSVYLRRLAAQGWQAEFFCVWPEDLGVTHSIAKAAGIVRPTIHCIYHDAGQFLNRVRRMSFFVGIKLHAVALATCANVPSLMLEYRPKCREFMASIGQQRLTRRTDALDVDDLSELTAVLNTDGAGISTSIRGAMLPIQRRLKEVGSMVVKLAQD